MCYTHLTHQRRRPMQLPSANAPCSARKKSDPPCSPPQNPRPCSSHRRAALRARSHTPHTRAHQTHAHTSTYQSHTAQRPRPVPVWSAAAAKLRAENDDSFDARKSRWRELLGGRWSMDRHAAYESDGPWSALPTAQHSKPIFCISLTSTRLRPSKMNAGFCIESKMRL